MNTNFVCELNNIISSFLCGGDAVDMEKYMGTYAYSKGGFQPICTVKLHHGKIYHLEFVYKFLAYKLKAHSYQSSLFFIISNNGIASTLKIFLREPVGELSESKMRLCMRTDVMLPRNAIIVICQDDFLKFKSPLVPVQDINLFNSLVVCRAYLTDKSSNMQFLIFQPGNSKKISYLLKMIVGIQGGSELEMENLYSQKINSKMTEYVSPRQPIRRIRERSMRSDDSGSEDYNSDESDYDAKYHTQEFDRNEKHACESSVVSHWALFKSKLIFLRTWKALFLITWMLLLLALLTTFMMKI